MLRGFYNGIKVYIDKDFESYEVAGAFLIISGSVALVCCALQLFIFARILSAFRLSGVCSGKQLTTPDGTLVWQISPLVQC